MGIPCGRCTHPEGYYQGTNDRMVFEYVTEEDCPKLRNLVGPLKTLVKRANNMKKYYEKNEIIIYNEDNLKVLNNLQDSSVNLIYCDILYNTGKVFDDYNDDLGTPLEAMEWYRPRIEEMKRVLEIGRASCRERV